MLKTTQLNIVQESSAFWRVILDNPPLNLLDPDTIGELQQLVAAIEAADALKVVVFESANPDYFIAHYDMSRAAETPSASVPGSLHPWADFTMRLAHCASCQHRRGQRTRTRGRQRVRPCLRSVLRELGTSVLLPAGGCGWHRSRWWRRRTSSATCGPRPRNRDPSRKRRYRCRDGGAVWSCEPRHTRCRFQQFRCHLRATDCIVRQAGTGGGEGIAESNRSADTRGFGVELGDVPAIAVMGRHEGQDHSVDQGRPVQAGRFRVAAGPSSWRPHGFGTRQWLIE